MLSLKIHSKDYQIIIATLIAIWASLVAQLVKNLPAMQETWVRSLGGEDPLEKEVATHSSILACRIPWTEELGRLHSMGGQRAGHGCGSNFVTYIYIYIESLCSTPE